MIGSHELHEEHEGCGYSYGTSNQLVAEAIRRGETVVSDDGQYRYLLSRRRLLGDGLVVWIMHNPSLADGKREDPTMRRVLSFSWDWGFQALAVVNLYAYVTPYPIDLSRAADPVGPQNDKWIRGAVAAADLVVCAWGSLGPDDASRRVIGMVSDAGILPKCLGTTAGGSPRHPLYVRKGTGVENLNSPTTPLGRGMGEGGE